MKFNADWAFDDIICILSVSSVQAVEIQQQQLHFYESTDVETMSNSKQCILLQ